MNHISEGAPRERMGDRDRSAPTPVAALAELAGEIAVASKAAAGGGRAASRQLSSIASRTDLRIAAINELALADPERKGTPNLVVDPETARQWADLDVTEFTRMRSSERQSNAMEAIAGHMRVSPEYAQALEKRAPAIAVSGKTINDEVRTQELAREAALAQARRHDELASQREARLAAIDASALASVARIRAEQVAEVTARLRHDPDPQLGKGDIEEAQRGIGASAAFGENTPLTAGADRGAIESEKLRIIKRPVQESELPQAIRTRFIISAPKQRLFEAGQTDFHFRAGNRQGQLAFSDAGKQLSTPLENREIIAAMLEVAQAKHWKEITVSGSEEFRRQAWLEGRLAGMAVNGYQVRDADTLLLQELQKPQDPREAQNRIAVAHRDRAAEIKSGQNSAGPQQGAHDVNVDDLTARERAGLRQADAILAARGVSPAFTAATMAELEKRVRGERVYVGSVVDFGAAPYQFSKDNDASYFITMKTIMGEQTIWGKDLQQAVAQGNVQKNAEIVLSNTGKRDVTVTEKVFGTDGVQTGIREKPAKLNQWTAQPLALYNQQERAAAAPPAQGREPSPVTRAAPEIRMPGRER